MCSCRGSSWLALSIRLVTLTKLFRLARALSSSQSIRCCSRAGTSHQAHDYLDPLYWVPRRRRRALSQARTRDVYKNAFAWYEEVFMLAQIRIEIHSGSIADHLF